MTFPPPPKKVRSTIQHALWVMEGMSNNTYNRHNDPDFHNYSIYAPSDFNDDGKLKRPDHLLTTRWVVLQAAKALRNAMLPSIRTRRTSLQNDIGMTHTQHKNLIPRNVKRTYIKGNERERFWLRRLIQGHRLTDAQVKAVIGYWNKDMASPCKWNRWHDVIMGVK